MYKMYQCSQCKGKEFYITIVSTDKLAVRCRRCKKSTEARVTLSGQRYKRCVEVGMGTSERRDSLARTAQETDSHE